MIAPVRVLAAPGDPGEPAALSSAHLAPILVWTTIAAVTIAALAKRGALSPARLRRDHARRADLLPAAAWFLAGLSLYLAVMLGGTVGGAIAVNRGWSLSGLNTQSLAMWAGYLPVLGVLALVALRPSRLRDDLSVAGIRAGVSDLWIGAGAFFLALPAVLATMLLSGFLADLLRGHAGEVITHDLLAQLVRESPGPAWWAVVLGVSVAAPIVEETIYRGCFQSAVIAATGSPAIGIVSIAAIFSLAHLSVVQPEALPALFVLGVAFGVAFERTGRLGVPIVMHVLFNVMNLVEASLIT